MAGRDDGVGHAPGGLDAIEAVQQIVVADQLVDPTALVGGQRVVLRAVSQELGHHALEDLVGHAVLGAQVGVDQLLAAVRVGRDLVAEHQRVPEDRTAAAETDLAVRDAGVRQPEEHVDVRLRQIRHLHRRVVGHQHEAIDLVRVLHEVLQADVRTGRVPDDDGLDVVADGRALDDETEGLLPGVEGDVPRLHVQVVLVRAGAGEVDDDGVVPALVEPVGEVVAVLPLEVAGVVRVVLRPVEQLVRDDTTLVPSPMEQDDDWPVLRVGQPGLVGVERSVGLDDRVLLGLGGRRRGVAPEASATQAQQGDHDHQGTELVHSRLLFLWQFSPQYSYTRDLKEIKDIE